MAQRQVNTDGDLPRTLRKKRLDIRPQTAKLIRAVRQKSSHQFPVLTKNYHQQTPGIDLRGAVNGCFVATKENDAPGLFRVPFEHIQSLPNSPKRHRIQVAVRSSWPSSERFLNAKPCAHPPNPTSLHSPRRRCPIGPFAYPDHENSHPFFRVVRRHNWRTRQIGSPAFRRVARNDEHQMRMPALAAVV